MLEGTGGGEPISATRYGVAAKVATLGWDVVSGDSVNAAAAAAPFSIGGGGPAVG